MGSTAIPTDQILKSNLIDDIIVNFMTFFQKNPNDQGFTEYIGGSGITYDYDNNSKLLKLKEPFSNLGILIEGYSDTNTDVKKFFNIVDYSKLTDTTKNPNISSSLVTNSANSTTYCPSTVSPCMYININNNYKYSYLPNFNADKNTINKSSKILDLCMIQYLDKETAVTTNISNRYSSIKTVDLLKGFYALYEILKVENVTKLQSNLEIIIQVPSELDPTNGTGDPNIVSYKVKYNNPSLILKNINSTDIDVNLTNSINVIMDISKILNDKNFNIFILRHLIYLYIQLFNYDIVLNLYKKYSSGDYNTFNNNHGILLNMAILILTILNTNLVELQSLKQSLTLTNTSTSNIVSYNNNLKNINTINNNINSKKDNLQISSNYIKNINKFKSTIKKYLISTAVILGLIIIISIVIETTSSEKIKYIGLLLIILLTVVSYIIINYIYGNKVLELFTTVEDADSKVENFQSEPKLDLPTLNFPAGINNTVDQRVLLLNITNLRSLIYNSLSHNISALSDLINAINYSKTYTDMVDILSKEVNTYSNVLTEIDNSTDKMNSSIMFYKYTQTKNIHLLYLLLNVMLIITIVVIIRAYLSRYNTVVSLYITILGIILIFISVIIYLLEINKKVRTDPTKLYWRGNEELVKKNL